MFTTIALIASGALILRWRRNRIRKDEFDKKTEKLQDRLHDILQLTLQFPYLENISFTRAWDPKNVYTPTDTLPAPVGVNGYTQTQWQRYDQFANIVFNYMSEVYHHFNGDRKRISQFIDMGGWVAIHAKIWLNPSIAGENDCYCRGFRNMMNDYANNANIQPAQ